MRDGKLEAGVFPTLVNHTYLLARVGGAYNAVRVEGNAVGSLFLHGLGAGSLPTASAVLGDLISIARQNNKLNSGFVKQVLPQADILPPEEACSTYYMRFMVKDDPGRPARPFRRALRSGRQHRAGDPEGTERSGRAPRLHDPRSLGFRHPQGRRDHAQERFPPCPGYCYRVMG